MTRSKATHLRFLENHHPNLTAGIYTLSVTQTVEVDQKPVDKFEASHKLGVFAERFSLTERDVFSVFPPAFSRGDHSNVLPHILLERSTLPWERLADDATRDLPWLTLLVFHGAESPPITTVRYGDLMRDPVLPGIGEHDPWQDPNEPINVIDVPHAVFRRIAPCGDDLALLAHARQSLDAAHKPVGPERAALIANRLPLADGTTTVHVVSVENRVSGGIIDADSSSETIRLVSLKNWSFDCTQHGENFSELARRLSFSDGASAGLALPALDADPAEIRARKSAGHMLLPHTLGDGRTTAAWYHGPLAQVENIDIAPTRLEPVDSADDLYCLDPKTQLLDVSYGAAWQLGRLKALRDKHFSLKLFNWKRAHAHELKIEGTEELFSGLFPERHNKTDTQQGYGEIESWLHDLALLDGVPFNYLVPDARMLPPESLRLFVLDWRWIEAMLDGAFSIGRVLKSDKMADAANKSSGATPVPHHKVISGVLIRSDIIAQWPGMHLAGFASDIGDNVADPPGAMDVLRSVRLAPDVLMVLFDGPVACIDLFLQPETLHFGFKDDDTGDPKVRAKPWDIHAELRDPKTGQLVGKDAICAAKWRNDQKDRVLNVTQFADDLAKALKLPKGEMSSAALALQMIDGADRVRIHIG